MRTYMILKEKAARWNADAEIQGILKLVNRQDSAISKLTKKFSKEKCQEASGGAVGSRGAGGAAVAV